MARLTDAQLAELEKRLARHEATPYPNRDHKLWMLEYQDALFEHGAKMIAELRALRAVRDAAERYHAASKDFAASGKEDGTYAIDLDREEAALFAALDAARGEA